MSASESSSPVSTGSGHHDSTAPAATCSDMWMCTGSNDIQTKTIGAHYENAGCSGFVVVESLDYCFLLLVHFLERFVLVLEPF